MKVHVFGNPDIAMDALPLRILPALREQFPNGDFRTLDPNEEWEIPDPFIVIDTVVGIHGGHLFRSLDEFSAAPAVSVHDFDALFNLRYLKKLGRLGEVRIIGLASELSEDAAIREVVRMLGEVEKDPAKGAF